MSDLLLILVAYTLFKNRKPLRDIFVFDDQLAYGTCLDQVEDEEEEDSNEEDEIR